MTPKLSGLLQYPFGFGGESCTIEALRRPFDTASRWAVSRSSVTPSTTSDCRARVALASYAGRGAYVMSSMTEDLIAMANGGMAEIPPRDRATLPKIQCRIALQGVLCFSPMPVTSGQEQYAETLAEPMPRAYFNVLESCAQSWKLSPESSSLVLVVKARRGAIGLITVCAHRMVDLGCP